MAGAHAAVGVALGVSGQFDVTYPRRLYGAGFTLRS
jgi:hypothetical protein